MDSYQLEKPVWDDSDFDAMGWHDARIWSMLADTDAFEFLLDLDYGFKWVHAVDGETYFRFWVAPVTMVFESAHTVRIDIESQLGEIEVADLFRQSPEPTRTGEAVQHTYRFDCQAVGCPRPFRSSSALFGPLASGDDTIRRSRCCNGTRPGARCGMARACTGCGSTTCGTQ